MNTDVDVSQIRDRMFAAKGGAVFIIGRNGAVLMERCPKKAAMFGGEWFLPGGKIEDGETPRNACVREAWEELAVVIEYAKALPVVDGAPAGWDFFPLHPFAVTGMDDSRIPETSAEGIPLRWVPVEEAMRSPVTQVRMMVAAARPYIGSDS